MPLFLERAGSWLLGSGIQEESGGVRRYYRMDRSRYAPVSTEITGYFASTCVYLISQTGDPAYLEAARTAARFLARVAWDPELSIFPYEYLHEADRDPPAYFFDCGIIVRGLLASWRATGEAELLGVARACGRTMGDAFLADGEIQPVLQLPLKRPTTPDGRWSSRPGCYQLKSALAWHDLSVPTGNKKYLSYYRFALEQAIKTERAFLPGDDDERRIVDRLHAYCYFLEGLLPMASGADHGETLREGIRRVEQWMRALSPVFERSDVYAQLLRLRLFADALSVLPLDQDAAEREAEKIVGFQLQDTDRRVDGGFSFGNLEGNPLPYANPVSTAFCLQTLLMWRQYREGQFRADPSVLI